LAVPKPDTCQGCTGYEWACPTARTGYVGPVGTGHNGVLLLFEAADEAGSKVGQPVGGYAATQLQQLLTRGNLNKADFTIANVLYCRPPDNYLVGAPYEQAVLDHCRPNLDATISRVRPRCIVAAGDVALRRMLPDCPVGIHDARGYMFPYTHPDGWVTWVLPTIHPQQILRGQTALTAVFIHDVTKAVEAARDGYAYLDTSFYTLDPTPQGAAAWMNTFEQIAACRRLAHLSCDIETPDKDANEDELEDEEAEDIKDISYTIVRCGYSYHDSQTGRPSVLTLPWQDAYLPIHRRLLESRCDKLWWNKSFDVPRILAAGIRLAGVMHDGMESWHVLNGDLRRSLGFVSSFLCPTLRMWKHLNNAVPAFYNAQDAYAADVNHIKTVADLHKHKLYHVYQEQILDLDPVYTSMSAAGMPVDPVRRLAFAKELSELQTAGRAMMQTVVPLSCRRLEPKEGYVRTPNLEVVRATLGPGESLIERLFESKLVKRCSACGMVNPKGPHRTTKSIVDPNPMPLLPDAAVVKVKRIPNPCYGAAVITAPEGVTRWVRLQPFVPSTKQILAYQELVDHKPEYDGRGADRKLTTNKKAIRKLRAKYSCDPLYPLITDDRLMDKLAGTYIGRYQLNNDVPGIVGGFPVGKDGRVHASFTNAPSTLRTSMRSPNLQNLPR
jgi:uracil-DNA glycosylase family 4